MPSRDLVPATPAQPPRFGLLVSAPTPEGVWRPGIKWEPEACSPGGSGPADCSPLERDAEKDTPGTVFSFPFLVWAVEVCSAMGFKGRDWIGRATRALAASQSHQVAHELWTGEITKAQWTGGDVDQRTPYLADALTTVITGDPGVSPVAALSKLESTALLCSEGRRIMLHVPTWLIEPLMTDSQYIRLDGNTLVTGLGSIIVPDTGYPGTKPDSVGSGGGNTWIYASPIVSVSLDMVNTYPAGLTDGADLNQFTGWAQNTGVVWAQRNAIYQLDPCCRYAIETNVPLTTLP